MCLLLLEPILALHKHRCLRTLSLKEKKDGPTGGAVWHFFLFMSCFMRLPFCSNWEPENLPARSLPACPHCWDQQKHLCDKLQWLRVSVVFFFFSLVSINYQHPHLFTLSGDWLHRLCSHPLDSEIQQSKPHAELPRRKEVSNGSRVHVGGKTMLTHLGGKYF